MDTDTGTGDGTASLLLARRPLSEPAASRLPAAAPHRREILAAHAAALRAAEAGYLDPVTGLFVLTAAYLAARGTCCGRGCRHCPYVDEPGADEPAGPGYPGGGDPRLPERPPGRMGA